jgi:hypothetical protein
MNSPVLDAEVTYYLRRRERARREQRREVAEMEGRQLGLLAPARGAITRPQRKQDDGTLLLEAD